MPLLGWSGIALADMSSCMATRYSRSFNFGFGSKRSLDGPCSDDEDAPTAVIPATAIGPPESTQAV